MSRPRLLVMTVGLGNSTEGLAEPITKVIETTRPQRVVFVCSGTSRALSLDPLLSAADSPLTGIRYDLEVVPDEELSNLEALTARMIRLLADLNDTAGGFEVHVDFTGGTKPMSAAAVLAAVASDVPFASYVEPRTAADDPRRVVGSGPVQVIGLDRNRFETRFERLTDLFDRGEYVACRLKCKRMERSADLEVSQHERLNTLRIMSECHAAWDRFQWRTAEQSLATLDPGTIARAGWSAIAVERAHGHLVACRGDEGVTLARAADILANAMRRLEVHHRADDAVARLYRLVEYLLQRRMRLLMREQPDVDPGNPTSTLTRRHLRQIAPVWTSQQGPPSDQDDAMVRLGLLATATVLAEAGDPLGEITLQQHGPPSEPGRLGSLLRRRNDSFLAHGSTPIEGKVARSLGEACHEFFTLAAELENADGPMMLAAARPIPAPRIDTSTERVA